MRAFWEVWAEEGIERCQDKTTKGGDEGSKINGVKGTKPIDQE